MAKSQLKFFKSVMMKCSVHGVLSDTGKFITYIDEDGDECGISIDDFLNAFCGKEITLVISDKNDEELDIEDDVSSISDKE